jgi:hypothetical protein
MLEGLLEGLFELKCASVLSVFELANPFTLQIMLRF